MIARRVGPRCSLMVAGFPNARYRPNAIQRAALEMHEGLTMEHGCTHTPGTATSLAYIVTIAALGVAAWVLGVVTNGRRP